MPSDLLHTARAKIDRELAGQHQVRVELLGIIGESFYGLRENAEAAEVLEQALNEAQALPDSDSGSILRLRRVLSQAYEFLGRSADSRRQLQIVLDAFERSGRRDNPELIEALLHKSLLDYYAAKYPDALEAAEKAQRLGESIPNPPVDAAFEAAELMASVHKAEERVELAVRGYRRAYELALGDLRKRPASSARAMGADGLCQYPGTRRSSKEALPYSQAAATAAAEIFGADSVMVGFFLNSLASIQIRGGGDPGPRSKAAASPSRSTSGRGSVGLAIIRAVCAGWVANCSPRAGPARRSSRWPAKSRARYERSTRGRARTTHGCGSLWPGAEPTWTLRRGRGAARPDRQRGRGKVDAGENACRLAPWHDASHAGRRACGAG